MCTSLLFWIVGCVFAEPGIKLTVNWDNLLFTMLETKKKKKNEWRQRRNLCISCLDAREGISMSEVFIRATLANSAVFAISLWYNIDHKTHRVSNLAHSAPGIICSLSCCYLMMTIRINPQTRVTKWRTRAVCASFFITLRVFVQEAKNTLVEYYLTIKSIKILLKTSIKWFFISFALDYCSTRCVAVWLCFSACVSFCVAVSTTGVRSALWVWYSRCSKGQRRCYHLNMIGARREDRDGGGGEKCSPPPHPFRPL